MRIAKQFGFPQTLMFSFVMFLVVAPQYAQQSNILINGDLETMEPAFWNKLNDGLGGAQVSWSDGTSHSWYRSFKVTKPSATSDAVGWTSVNNADLFWNNAVADRVYDLSFWAKTEGVNTHPASNDAKIGVKYEFYSGGLLLGEQFVEVDQSTANKNWIEYSGSLSIPVGAEPDEVYIKAFMGKNATGTVYFDDIDCRSEPWSMGPFNYNAETPIGWMVWTAGEDSGIFKIDSSVSHSGMYSVSLEDWDNNSDELVWYSAPVPAKPNTWYKVSAWVKWENINTNGSFLPSNVTRIRDDQRIGFTFFFHRDPIERDWNLTPGDILFYIDQREASGEWTEYSVIYKSPEDAAGVSFRARFTSFPTGKVWYDDFSVEEITFKDEILVNGDLEIMEPAFWNKWNDGLGGAQVMWSDGTSQYWYRSFKVTKPLTTSDAVGWISDNNADLYWNNALADRVYKLSFWAKTEGVNTHPASADAKIGVNYEFYSGGLLLGEQFVEVDQNVANKNWTEYSASLSIPVGAEPDGVYIKAFMGKNATGTVYFDDINCGSEPWSMGPFNYNAETPIGWMFWTAGEDDGIFKIDSSVSHSGTYSVSLEDWDNDNDELVWYSAPVLAKPNTWYKVSAWVKWENINTNESFLPSNVTRIRDDQRIGFTFFFHRDPIERDWNLTPGDILFYIDQREDSGDWTEYSVIYKSPEDAAGVSLRARFTSFPTGKVWYDDFSVKEVETVTDQSPPEIIHSPVSIAVSGQSQTISTNLTDNAGIQSAVLYYRKGGASLYTSTAMNNASGDTWEGTIPASFITERGTEYHIAVSDINGNTSTYPESDPQNYPQVIKVNFSNLSFTNSTTPMAYQMISVPVYLDNTSPSSVLEDNLGNYNDTQWRLLQYANGNYNEYPNVSNFEPGKGFWLITREAKSLDTGAGKSVTTAQNYQIILQPGWNQIGNPYAFTVNWSDVIKNDSVESPLVGYSGSSNDESGYDYNRTQLVPFEAYFVKNNSSSEITIEIPPKSASGSSSIAKHSISIPGIENLQGNEWMVRIKAKSGRYVDKDNYIGVLNSASDKWDSNDFSEAPFFEDLISLYFPHLDWDSYPGLYTGDFRSITSDGHYWDFHVKTNTTDSEVTLILTQVQNLPPGWEILLLDRNTHTSLNFLELEKYTYIPGENETERKFRIVVGQAEFIDANDLDLAGIPQDFFFSQNYPNPFNSETLLNYELPKVSDVNIAVFNLNGQLVKTLFAGLRSAGRYVVSWNGTTQDGSYAVSGVYLVRMKAGNFMAVKKILLVE